MARSFCAPLKRNAIAAFIVFGLIASPLFTPLAHAQFAPFAASGNFAADDTVQSTVFNVTQTENFTFFTTSYAGGTNADHSQTAASGFDPILTLFDSSDNTIDYNDDDTTGFVNTDPTTGLAADSYLTETLTRGTYRLAISEYDNFAPTDFADYTEAGNPTFTSEFSNPFSPLPGPFLDPTGAQRTSTYTYNIVASAANPVPESSSGFILGLLLAFGGVLVVLQKRLIFARRSTKTSYL